MYTGKLIEADDIRAEGRKEGRLKARRQTACGMLAEGFSDALIQEITGLSDEELQQLKLLNN